MQIQHLCHILHYWYHRSPAKIPSNLIFFCNFPKLICKDFCFAFSLVNSHKSFRSLRYSCSHQLSYRFRIRPTSSFPAFVFFRKDYDFFTSQKTYPFPQSKYVCQNVYENCFRSSYILITILYSLLLNSFITVASLICPTVDTKYPLDHKTRICA